MQHEVPSYAVIFVSKRRGDLDDDYTEMDRRMAELVRQQPGFCGVDSVSDPEGRAITISYWQRLEDIQAWGDHPAHREAQRQGQLRWYQTYRLVVTKVEHDRHWGAGG